MLSQTITSCSKKRKLLSRHCSELQRAGGLQATRSDNSLLRAFARVLLSGTSRFVLTRLVDDQREQRDVVNIKIKDGFLVLFCTHTVCSAGSRMANSGSI